MKVPFTWQPTGWFMIGWSAQFEPGTSHPLKYLGHDLVAYRSAEGVLHVLSAHCQHLGAHLGHGGKVNGDCISCPFHGWTWGPDGTNRSIPYEDRPNPSKQIRTWAVKEQQECVFLWHDPAGGTPRRELPDLYTMAPMPHTRAEDFYRSYPEMSVKCGPEPVHPQIALENAPDSIHFAYVHGATVDPVLINFDVQGYEYVAHVGWPKPGQTDGFALELHTIFPGVGLTFLTFAGAQNYRVIFAVTPIDNDNSDLFYSVFWPRVPGDESPIAPEKMHKMIAQQILPTLEQDLGIWRHQIYIENPALAKQDARPYGALRKWAKQFYEVSA
jgi:3-ketosteroid 9alpha-monooxygenase subunit A